MCENQDHVLHMAWANYPSLNMWACEVCRSMGLLAEAPEQEYHRDAAGVAIMAFFMLKMCWPEVKASLE